MTNLSSEPEGLIPAIYRNKPTDPHFCPFCGEIIPPQQVSFGALTRWVQPRCQHEVEDFERTMAEAKQETTRQKIRSAWPLKLGNKSSAADLSSFERMEGNGKALDAVGKFCASWTDPENAKPTLGLVIFGQPGNGKTHLVAAMAKLLYHEYGAAVIYARASDIYQRIKATWEGGGSQEHLEDMLVQCDVLIIDDLGREKASEWRQEILDRIITDRVEDERPIIATTNLGPKPLEARVGFRVMDRLLGNCEFIQNRAESYRRLQARRRSNAK